MGFIEVQTEIVNGSLPRTAVGVIVILTQRMTEDDRGDNDNVRVVEERNDDNAETGNSDQSELIDSQTPLFLSTQCKGSANCFRGTVTEIVGSDTLDVDNSRVRLSMVNTPERGDPGYEEATDTTESECPVGSEALVDEDDGQKGVVGRLIGGDRHLL
jgi:endonuclease YncB( thermonuclease family)